MSQWSLHELIFWMMLYYEFEKPFMFIILKTISIWLSQAQIIPIECKKVPRDMNLLVMRSNLLRRRLHMIWSCDQPSCWLFFNQEWNVIWRSDTLMVNALFNVLRGDSGDPRQQDLQQSLLWQPLSKQWCLWAGQVPGLPLSLSPTESWLHLPSRWVHFKILLSNLTVRQEH